MGYNTEFEQEYFLMRTGVPLPETVASAYDLLECLRQSKEKAVWKARRRADGALCIVKIAYADQRRYLRAEWECLNAMQSAKSRHFPAPLQYEQEGNCAWLARSWCEGESLASLVRENGFLPEKQVIHYGMLLCDALNELHALGYVLRDVKPENLVIAPEEDSIALVDCDAARQYNAQKACDTLFVVSRQTAAPEQYGFSQSDMRTDVFGAGRTLLYAACGCYRESQLDRVQMSRRLKRTILRATNLHPERRYPNGLALKQALQRCEKRRGRPLLAVAVLCVAAIFVAGAARIFPMTTNAPQAAQPQSVEPPGQEASLADLWHLEYHEFCADNYQAMLDSALTSYAAHDEQSLADACEALIAALYEDPSLLQGEKVDYALLSPLPEDFFVVSNEQRINYGLWYSAETLRRNLGAYGEYVSHFFRCLDEDLDSAARGERISSIYTYLEMPLGERDEVLDYALGDLVLLLGRAIDTPPP